MLVNALPRITTKIGTMNGIVTNMDGAGDNHDTLGIKNINTGKTSGSKS